MQGNLRGSLSVCWLFDMIRWRSGSGSLIKQHALRGVAPARICASGSRFLNPQFPPRGLPPSPNPPSLLFLSSFFSYPVLFFARPLEIPSWPWPQMWLRPQAGSNVSP